MARGCVVRVDPDIAVPMSTDLTLDHRALEAYLPHRGVNLMPDTVAMNAGRTVSRSRTRVAVGDPRGRELLGRDAGGRRAWSECFIAELMALTGVPLLNDRLAPAGQVAVFSMISRVVVPHLPDLAGDLDGLAEITRDRGSFTQFGTRASIGGTTCLEAEVMSGCAKMTDINSAPVRPFPGAMPGTAIDPGLFAWKPAPMRFVSTVVQDDPAARRLVCAYTYPTDHPFVPGHFPSGALMMGVTQWQAVADAAWTAKARFGLAGPVQASGRIIRPDGAEVVDVRDLLLVEDAPGIPRMASTKRIAFREPVRPGDGILIEVTVAPAAG
jgi:3-hydroxymyristoyl/3-hydroxydecanoyl-(acyl carrier protein) dehydratase